MNWQEYQEAAMRTQADQRVILNRLIALGPKAMQFDNAVTGLSDEVGELNNAKKKWIEYGQELDVTNVKEEVGDCLWRLNQICTALGLTLEECAQSNILKLASRYPEKYSDHLAAESNRNREAERETLGDVIEKVEMGLETDLKFGGSSIFPQTGQGWAEPPEDYDGTDPIHITTTPTPRISEKTFQETGYTDICRECNHTPVHHTNTFKVCGTCWAKSEIKVKYVPADTV